MGMQTYRIKDWDDDRFLKRDALRSSKPPWISVPTDHGSRGIGALAATEGGGAAYGAFVLIVAVVARCDTKGGRLVDEDGRAIDPAELSLRTRFPAALFDVAIPILERVGWLVKCSGSTGSATHCRKSASKTPDTCGKDEVCMPTTVQDSTGQYSTVGAAAEVPQKIGKDGRRPRSTDPLWNELAAIWFPSGVTDSDRTRVGKLVRGFKAKRALLVEIRERLERYTAKWPNAAATPEALLKHWDQFGPPAATQQPGQSKREQDKMEREWRERQAKCEHSFDPKPRREQYRSPHGMWSVVMTKVCRLCGKRERVKDREG